MQHYLSFSGGGFNSHSLLAGMIAGSLDTLEKNGRIRDLGLLTRSVDGFSANSGGSWFLSQLSYSQKFLNQFKTSQSADLYNSTGYNGQIADIYQNISTKNEGSNSPGIVRKILSNTNSPTTSKVIQSWISLLSNSGLSWRNFNQKITFKPFAMTDLMSAQKFNGERLSWASNKDFVVATSLQAEPVVLDSIGTLENKIFAQAVSEAVDESAQTIPLSLKSVASDLSSAPTYQSSAQLPSGVNLLRYSTNAWFGGPSDQQIDLPTSIDASELSIFDVTTASSSAVGLLAAPASYAGILGTSEASLASPLINQLAYELSDLAPPATFKNGAIEMPSEVQTGSSLKAQFNLLSTELTTRLTDGAYVDNTSAAYMVKQIQSEQTIDDYFYLTIFSNSTSTPESGITMPGVSQTQEFTVTSDIADLFGYSDGKAGDSAVITNTTLGNQLTPSPHVFALDAWEDIEPLWTYGSGTIDISLYRLSVETVDNEAFGVKAGHSGFVDIYVSRNSGSAPAPYKASNLSAYEQNYDVFRNGISNGGFKYLSESFGIVSNQIQPYEGASSSELISAAVTAAGADVDVSVKKIAPLRRAQNKSDQLSFRGSDDDDIILHPKTNAVIYGGEGSDLHLMKHADRSSSQKSKISKSIIMDFEEEDKVLLNRRQFGRKLTFEHAMNRRQKKSFQESEADFVFFDHGALPGGDQTRTSRLYYNANGSKPGWGDEGGLFIHFHNGHELTLSDLASF